MESASWELPRLRLRLRLLHWQSSSSMKRNLSTHIHIHSFNVFCLTECVRVVVVPRIAKVVLLKKLFIVFRWNKKWFMEPQAARLAFSMQEVVSLKSNGMGRCRRCCCWWLFFSFFSHSFVDFLIKMLKYKNILSLVMAIYIICSNGVDGWMDGKLIIGSLCQGFCAMDSFSKFLEWW